MHGHRPLTRWATHCPLNLLRETSSNTATITCGSSTAETLTNEFKNKIFWWFRFYGFFFFREKQTSADQEAEQIAFACPCGKLSTFSLPHLHCTCGNYHVERIILESSSSRRAALRCVFTWSPFCCQEKSKRAALRLRDAGGEFVMILNKPDIYKGRFFSFPLNTKYAKHLYAAFHS